MPVLRVVELQIEPSYSLFNHDNIPVNFSYLAVDRRPPQLHSFVNLEFLCLQNVPILLLDFITSMRKLSHLDVKPMAEIGEDIGVSLK